MRLPLSPLTALLLGVAAVPSATAAPGQTTGADCDRPTARKTLTGRPVIRDGFHFQVMFGFGGGPDSVGIFHAMEIGGTFRNGFTIELLHVFIQNDGIISDVGGPDLIGGWMPAVKFPLVFDDLIFKVGVGLGGIHIQEGGIKAKVGLGVAYGLDFHLPFFRRSGLTFSVTLLHVWYNYKGDHTHFGGALGVGYTFF